MTASNPRTRASAFFLIAALALSSLAAMAFAAGNAGQAQIRDLVNRGTRFYEEARLADALVCYEQAARMAPDYEPLQRVLQDTRRNLNHQRALVRTVQAAGRKPDEEAHRKYQAACQLFDRGQLEKARIEFNETWLLAGNYKDTLGYLRQIRNRSAGAQPTNAQAPSVVRAPVSAPSQEAPQQQIETAIQRAEQLLDAEKFLEASKAYRAALEIDPQSRAARKGLRRAEKAIAQAQQEAQERAEKRDRLLARAQACMQEGEYEDAIEQYEEAREVDPQDGRAAEGIELARRAVEKRDAEKHRIETLVAQALETAQAQREAGNLDQARMACSKALEADPDNRSVKRALSRIEKDIEKRREEEIERREEVAEEVAEGREYLADERFDKALNAFSRALALDSESREAAAGRAQALAAIERQREAQRMRQQVAEQAMGAGRKALAESDYEEAIRQFETALQSDPDDEDAKDALELAQHRRKEAIEARQERIAQEKARQAEEQERLAAEKARRDAEERQRIAEAKERQAEQERIAQEKARQAEEQEGLAAEKARRDAEERQRIAEAKERQAEQERIAQEKARRADEQEGLAAEKARRDATERKRLAQPQQPDKVNESLERGRQMLEAGDYAAAQQAFEKALSVDEDSRDAKAGLEQVAEAREAAARRKAAQAAEEQARLLAEKARAEQAQRDAAFDAAMAKGVESLQNAEYADAAQAFESAVQIDPTDRKARRGLKRAHALYEQARRLEQSSAQAPEAESSVAPAQVASAQSEQQEGVQYRGVDETESQMTPAELRRQVREMLAEAEVVYSKERNVARAREIWQKVLKLAPDNKTAQTMMEGTQEEFERYVADRKRRQEAIAAEQAAREKMRMPITINTNEATPLAEFLKTLSLPSGINFTIAEGAEAMVNVNFVDKPLHEILDMVLLPIGLKWRRQGDVVIVDADLKTKTFRLDTQEMSKIQTLMENKTLQRILWGPKAVPPLKRTVLQLEERENLLMAVDSVENIEKLVAFLGDLRVDQPEDLVTRIYTIREKDGPQVKALIDAVLRSEKTPYDLERNVFLEGQNLIIRDTRSHIKKIEEMLLDKEFIRKLGGGDDLQIASFNLAPRDELAADHDLARDFFDNTREVIETFLYGEEGKSRAEAEGRRMWSDPTTFQITITDYPAGIRAVSDYIASLPHIRHQEREAVIFLEHLESTEMASQISSILDLQTLGGAGGVGGTGTERTFRLRRDQEVEWRDLRIRLRRVEENDVQDDSDDSCELIIRTPTDSREETIDEFLSVFIDDYEFVADDIRPSGTEGEGSVRLIVRYIPPAGADQAEAAPVIVTPTEGPMEPVINSFGSQNALIIRYEDPADLQRITELIEQLDKPIPQVDIETRFVTVNEQRAKEFSSELQWFDRDAPLQASPRVSPGFVPTDLQIGGLMDSDGLFSDYTLIDTWFQEIFGYKIFWGLTILEAEGIVNITNGPRILVMDGETADFVIERPVITEVEYDENGNIESITYEWREVVDLSVSPQVTSEQAILLEVNVFIEDRGYDESGAGLDSYNAGPLWAQYPGLSPRGNSGTRLQTFKDSSDMGGPRKTVETNARIASGGTAVLGGWTGEFSEDLTSGVPVLRNLPWIGKLFFSRNRHNVHKTNLLVFLSGRIVE